MSEQWAKVNDVPVDSGLEPTNTNLEPADESDDSEYPLVDFDRILPERNATRGRSRGRAWFRSTIDRRADHKLDNIEVKILFLQFLLKKYSMICPTSS